MRHLLLIGWLLLSLQTSAQQPTDTLDAVFLTADTFLRDYSGAQQLRVFTDTTLYRSPASLTSLLRQHTAVFLRENGLGMVSSASFRGTTAQHTAVVWNGININSLTTGQTDFNTISIRGFDQISVRAGGGSTTHGTGAIGGSIHLDNDLVFQNTEQHRLLAGYGSFSTYDLAYSTQLADENRSFSFTLGRNGSQNDYPFPDNPDRRNDNGQFYNNNLQLAMGYRLDKRNILKFYGQLVDAKRHFSLISPNSPRTLYRDFNLRNLLEWKTLGDCYTGTLKLAYLQESYRYYPSLDQTFYTHGQADSKIVKYDAAFAVSKGIQVNAVADYMQNQGKGSDLQPETRHIGAGSIFLKHHLGEKFLYEAGLRQEFTREYKTPLLYNLGLHWDAARFYRIKARVSKNFRIPTFNDLYWQGSGKPDLRPETSLQTELTQEFHLTAFRFSLTAYHNRVGDLIQWVPVSGDFWQPENVDAAAMYGLETFWEWKKKFGEHRLAWQGTYAYTISKDDRSGKQLIYVPYHKATTTLDYTFRKVSVYQQLLYTGPVYTTADNRRRLDGYTLFDVGAEVSYTPFTFGVQLRNLWNKAYAVVQNRPMPGRHVMGTLRVEL